MKRATWMSDAGYASGVRAERANEKFFRRMEKEAAELEKLWDDRLTAGMFWLVVVGMCVGAAIGAAQLLGTEARTLAHGDLIESGGIGLGLAVVGIGIRNRSRNLAG